MKFRKLPYLILFLLFTINTYAQKKPSTSKPGAVNVKYTIGSKTKQKSFTSSSFHVKSTESSHTMMQFRVKGVIPYLLLFPWYQNVHEYIYLNTYDEKLKQTETTKINDFEVYAVGKLKKHTKYLVDIAKIEGENYAFYYQYNREKHQVDFYVTQLNLEAGYAEGDPVFLTSIKPHNSMFFGVGLNYGLVFSEQKNYFMFYTKQKFNRRERKANKGRSRYRFMMFDSTFTKKYNVGYTLKKNNTLPGTSFNALKAVSGKQNPVIIDNLGSFYFLEQQQIKKKKKITFRKRYDTYITGYNRSQKKISSNLVSSADNTLIDLCLSVDQNNSALVAALFEKEEKAAIRLSLVDSTGEFVTVANQNFSVPDYRKMLAISSQDKDANKKPIPEKDVSDKKIERAGKNNLALLKIREVLNNNDGSYLVMAEQYYITMYSSQGSNGSSQTHTVYHYLDIFIFKVNADGEVQNIQRIPKYYTTVDMKINTFIISRNDQEVKIIYYNYTKKNKSSTRIAIINNETGKIRTSDFTPLSLSKHYFLNLSSIAFLPNNKILGVAQRGKSTWMFTAKVK